MHIFSQKIIIKFIFKKNLKSKLKKLKIKNLKNYILYTQIIYIFKFIFFRDT
jgi:hypothetical protein